MSLIKEKYIDIEINWVGEKRLTKFSAVRLKNEAKYIIWEKVDIRRDGPIHFEPILTNKDFGNSNNTDTNTDNEN